MLEFVPAILAKCVEVGECLEWRGAMGHGNNASKPIFGRTVNGKRHCLSVVRLVWEAQHGPIPEGKIVYRLCGNARCVSCLRLGVRGDAHRWRKKMGRSAHSPSTIASITRGTRRRTDLRCNEVLAARVRALVAEGMPDAEIAAATGLGPATVADIRRGRLWRPSVAASSVFGWRPGA